MSAKDLFLSCKKGDLNSVRLAFYFVVKFAYFELL